MSGHLARILARKAQEVAAARERTPVAELRACATDAPPPRGFARALESAVAAGRSAVIAEFKRASPSKGVLRADLDPASVARSYERGGAACLSVLTDAPFFQGSLEDLRAARAACALPVLRKDFTLDPWQVYEARAAGADAVLLIVAALQDGPLAELHGLACELGLDVLVEVHDAAELARAAALRPALLGINNRDLATFETRLETTLALAPRAPPGRRVVSESGIHTADDVARLRDAGVCAFLVGEACMRAPDPGQRLAELFGPPQ
jgi:indole-3-glycerol phosphate synthase